MSKQSQSSVPTSCLWCGGLLGEVKYRDVSDRLGYVPGTWDLIECGTCKSLGLSPFPSPAQVVDYYPQNYIVPTTDKTQGIRTLFSAIDQRFLAYCYQKEAALLFERLPAFKTAGAKILEIGCGNGNRMDFFRSKNLDITGVDMSQEDIKAIRARGLNALCVDLHAITDHFQSGSFDVIMSFDVLEHIPDLESFFEKTTRLLKPLGWMVAGLPAQDCYASRVLGKEWTALREVPRHVTVPSIQGARQLFTRFGLKNTGLFPYSSLSCSIVLGNSFVPSSSASNFYSGSFKIRTLMKRLFGGVITLLSAPLFFLENQFTSHPSRFVVYGQTK